MLTCILLISLLAISSISDEVKKVSETFSPSLVQIETIGGRDQVGGQIAGTPTSDGVATGVLLPQTNQLRSENNSVKNSCEIVTSSYPFQHQPSAILARFFDGSSRAARHVATDHTRMITLLEVESPPEIFPNIPSWQAAKNISLTQNVIALGFALSPQQINVAFGIVSGKNRLFGKAIQTDAAISPYYYGGLLVTPNLHAVGLLVPLDMSEKSRFADTAIYDSGIGFAILWDEVTEKIVPRLRQEKEERNRKDLWSCETGIDFHASSVWTGAAIIATCAENSRAHRAGIKSKDKILAINETPIYSARDAMIALAKLYRDDEVRIKFLRNNAEHDNVEHIVTLPQDER